MRASASCAAGEGGDVLPGQPHLTVGGFGDAGDDPHHGGLATTVGAQNYGKLARSDGEAGALQRQPSGCVTHAEVFCLDLH